MAASAADLFMEVGTPGTATNLAGDGYTQGEPSIQVDTTTNFPTATGVIFGIDRINIVNGQNVRVPNSYCVFAGRVTGAGQISDLILLNGTAQDYAPGATTRVYITVSSQWVKRLVQGITAHANQDGSLKTSAVQAALSLGTGSLNGWNPLGFAPNTVTYNGNRSYDLVFNGQDLSGVLTAGMRLRTTRTVTAATQCASLNGTSQYFSKTAPAGMTFTDDFTVSGWVKPTSYPAADTAIISRYNGTSGWAAYFSTDGRLSLAGFNAAGTNYTQVKSYQSLPLNKWSHVTLQLDMSTAGVSTTTSYIMVDGVDISCLKQTSGTAPAALIQAGNLEIGSQNGGLVPFPGKIAQMAVFSAKVTQATIRGYINQGLSGTETSLISAYSFNNAITDLNTTSANNLTAVNGATAANADSPFGDSGVSGVLDYGIVMTKPVFSTNTTIKVQVPEGCTIPTSGGVSAVVYSNVSTPYGFQKLPEKWLIEMNDYSGQSVAVAAINTWYPSLFKLNVPAGSFHVGWAGSPYGSSSGAGANYNFAIYNGTAFDVDYVVNASTTGSVAVAPSYRRKPQTLAAATDYTFRGYQIGGGAPSTYNTGGSLAAGIGMKIFAENGLL